MTSTLHEDVCKFMLMCRKVLLRMRNVADKKFRENRNTFFLFDNFFYKVLPFMG